MLEINMILSKSNLVDEGRSGRILAWEIVGAIPPSTICINILRDNIQGPVRIGVDYDMATGTIRQRKL